MGDFDIAGRRVIVISNPVAGNGRGLRYGQRLVGSLTGVFPDISWEITQENPGIRVQGIITALRSAGSVEAPVVIVCAGDGTVAEVCQAIRAVQTDEFKPLLVPGPGGTAGDMRRELGVPNSPTSMLRFLSTARPVDLDVVTAKNDDGPERLVIHSDGNGVSGAFFGRVAQRREETGRVSIAVYLQALAAGVAAAEVFYVSIDGGPHLPVGEVFTGVNSTSMGAVTRIPLPAGGARIHAIPLDPSLLGPFRIAPGLPPLLDAFRLGALYMAGTRTVISPGAVIGHLSDEHMRDVNAGQSAQLAFFDAGGRPKQVLSVMNGDPTGPASTVVVHHTGEAIRALAAPDSAHMVRRGLARPTTLAQRMLSSGAALSFSGVMMLGDGAGLAVADGETAGDEAALTSLMIEAGATSVLGGNPVAARAPLALLAR